MLRSEKTNRVNAEHCNYLNLKRFLAEETQGIVDGAVDVGVDITRHILQVISHYFGYVTQVAQVSSYRSSHKIAHTFSNVLH